MIMYFDEARTFLPWIMDQLIRTGKINPEEAPELHAAFDHNRYTFEDMIRGICQRNGRPIDPDTLKRATFSALGQLYEKMRTRGGISMSDMDAWGQNTPLESFYQPRNNYNYNAPAKDPIMDINNRTYNMFNNPAPAYQSPTGSKSANGLFYEEESQQQPPQHQQEPQKQQRQPEPVKEEVSPTHISFRFIELGDREHMTTEEKLHLRISGATRQKIDNGIFKLNRQVIAIKNNNNEALNIKYDNVDLFNSHIMFDSDRDVFDFLSGQMSREDVDKVYFRVTSFYKLKQLDIDHDLFFREKERLDEMLNNKNLHSTKELYDNLDVVLQCYNVLKTMDSEYVSTMEAFLLEEINDFLKTYIRLGQQAKRVIACDCIKDLDEFLKDSKFAGFRNMETFENMMNQLLKTIINYLHGDGDSMFFNFDSSWQNVYTKTRKYITLSSASNGLNSMDYHQYSPELQQIMNTEIKKKVLVGVPETIIMTNCYNPGFIRNCLATMGGEPKLIPNDLNVEDFNNFIYYMLYKQKDINRRLPSNLLYVLGENEIKMLKLNMTLDNYLIVG